MHKINIYIKEVGNYVNDIKWNRGGGSGWLETIGSYCDLGPVFCTNLTYNFS